MKLIISRKGFDSQYGKVASPIFPDGRMVSLPIPSWGTPKAYGDIWFGNHALGAIASSLTGRLGFRRMPAHLDPDLDAGALPRRPGWRPAFGQVGAAAQHLRNQGIETGDLFLFFGWFREVETTGGGWEFRRGAPDIHALFGWLQIGEILNVGEETDAHRAARPELADHPHLNGTYHHTNTVFVASDRLVIDGQDMGVPGGGTFGRFHPGLQLTKPGQTRTVWSLPGWFLPTSGPVLSYHQDPKRWERDDERCTLRSVAKGQEFAMPVHDSGDLAKWVTDLLRPQSTASHVENDIAFST